VAELYAFRQDQGRRTSAGKAAKLVINSIYGKLAQSVGRRPFGCLVYGGLITASCRAQILQAIASHPLGPEGVVQIATDAVTFLQPHPHLKLSDRLGDWEETRHRYLCLFKPGVNWDDDARKALRDGHLPRFKARGIAAKHFARHLPQIDDEFCRVRDAMAAGAEPWWPKLTYETDVSLVTPRMALHRSQWHQAGKVSHAEIRQSSDPVTKRSQPYYDERYGVIRSRPYAEVEQLVSAPHRRRGAVDTAGNEVFGEPLDEQRIRLTPDGAAHALFAEMLGLGQ
jgi:hypothetical protein